MVWCVNCLLDGVDDCVCDRLNGCLCYRVDDEWVMVWVAVSVLVWMMVLVID